MKVFNTLSGKKENLVPIEENKIKMYVCGMTVYDDTHIGHARTFISFDLIVRYLRSINYEVHYIRNITDVDDKIIAKDYHHQYGQEHAEINALNQIGHKAENCKLYVNLNHALLMAKTLPATMP